MSAILNTSIGPVTIDGLDAERLREEGRQEILREIAAIDYTVQFTIKRDFTAGYQGAPVVILDWEMRRCKFCATEWDRPLPPNVMDEINRLDEHHKPDCLWSRAHAATQEPT